MLRKTLNEYQEIALIIYLENDNVYKKKKRCSIPRRQLFRRHQLTFYITITSPCPFMYLELGHYC